MVMVILLLFAVAVAGATGYQIVSAERDLAGGGGEQEEALSIARAGIERYAGEHIGVPGASVTYAIGSGNVTVTQKRVARPWNIDGEVAVGSDVEDDSLQMWMLQAVGTVPDPRYPSSPATRTIRQYARLHNRPVKPWAAVIWNTSGLRLGTSSIVDGRSGDNSLGSYPATSPACDDTGTDAPYGVAAAGPSRTPGGNVFGGWLQLSSATQVNDAADVRWSVLSDPSFTIPYEANWSNPSNWSANFAAIPADSFPVIRISGDLQLTSSRSGRGALIVTGDVSMGTGFAWSGIILAATSAGLEAATGALSTICGMFVAGLNQTTSSGNHDIRWVDIQYQEYAMAKANRSLAYFELLDGTHWEF